MKRVTITLGVATLVAIAVLRFASHRRDFGHATSEPNTLRFLIESSPNNPGLRQGIRVRGKLVRCQVYSMRRGCSFGRAILGFC